MDIPGAKYLCPVEPDGKRRSQKQQNLCLYAGDKCMGCYSCYSRNVEGGLGTTPIRPLKVIVPGKELVTTNIDAFLSEDVALMLEGIQNPINLITKNPDVALKSLLKYPNIWNKLDYHIQVTTIRDGVILDLSSLPKLVRKAKSISARIDPIIPGLCKDEEIVKHLEHLKKTGIKHNTSNTLKIYWWQHYPDNVMRYYSDNEYVTRKKTSIMINQNEEVRIFRLLRETTDRLGMTLGICMSRPSMQEFATAPCEGGVYIGKYRKQN